LRTRQLERGEARLTTNTSSGRLSSSGVRVNGVEYSKREISAWLGQEEKVIKRRKRVGARLVQQGGSTSGYFLLTVLAAANRTRISTLAGGYSISGVRRRGGLVLTRKPRRQISGEIERLAEGDWSSLIRTRDGDLSDVYRGAPRLCSLRCTRVSSSPLERWLAESPVLTSNLCSFRSLAMQGVGGPLMLKPIGDGYAGCSGLGVGTELRKRGSSRKEFSWKKRTQDTESSGHSGAGTSVDGRHR